MTFSFLFHSVLPPLPLLSSPFFFSRSDKQRPHLSAGQGKCLSHLLQESQSPQELWRQSGGPPGPSGAPLAPPPDQRRTRKKRRPLGGCPAVYPGHTPPPNLLAPCPNCRPLSKYLRLPPPVKAPRTVVLSVIPPPPRAPSISVSLALWEMKYSQLPLRLARAAAGLAEQTEEARVRSRRRAFGFEVRQQPAGTPCSQNRNRILSRAARQTWRSQPETGETARARMLASNAADRRLP